MLFPNETMLLSWKIVTRNKFGTSLILDEDKTFSGFLVLGFRI